MNEKELELINRGESEKVEFKESLSVKEEIGECVAAFSNVDGGIILDRLDGRGVLWEMVEQIEEFLKKHINFMGFRTEKSFQREDKFDIPIKAIRELIINALIHRDYETTSDVRVFIFDDRVEIINPGAFPKGVTPSKPLHKPVNRLISQYMYDIGFIEKYGSGIITVKALLKGNG